MGIVLEFTGDTYTPQTRRGNRSASCNTDRRNQKKGHATERKKTHTIIRMRGCPPVIRQRRRQLWPLLPIRHKRPNLVLVPFPLIRIIPEVLRIRTVVRRIHDERIRSEVVAPSVPEPDTRLARIVRRRRFLHGRSRRLRVRALDGGRWEWVLASLSRCVAAAALDGVWIARVRMRRRRG